MQLSLAAAEDPATVTMLLEAYRATDDGSSVARLCERYQSRDGYADATKSCPKAATAVPETKSPKQ
ncbi:MAG: hypothetical protein R3E66_04140 [bacterium]